MAMPGVLVAICLVYYEGLGFLHNAYTIIWHEAISNLGSDSELLQLFLSLFCFRS